MKELINILLFIPRTFKKAFVKKEVNVNFYTDDRTTIENKLKIRIEK